jgi:hypothetical protein
LKSIEFKNAKFLGIYCLGWCYNLESVILPDTLETIDKWAFFSCEALKELKIPKNVNFINYGILNYPSNELIVVVDGNNTTYDSRDNCNAIIETTTNKLVAGCNNTIIPNTVEELGMYSFRGCSFEYLEIPSSVKKIGMECFDSCINLKNLTLPKNSLLDGAYSFNYCKSLEWIVIYNCYSISYDCFRGCESLQDIYLKGEEFVRLSDLNAFENAKLGINLHVRPELVEQYNSDTNWKTLIDSGQIVIVGDIVEEMSE